MIEIYTDGACQPNPGKSGIGFLIISNNKIVKKFSHYLGCGTNNIAELTAIQYALQFILSHSKENEEIKLYSDSEYAIGCLTKNWNIKKNIELINEIKNIIKKFKNISFIWVKAHDKNEYNNMVDSLAVDIISKNK